MREYIVQDQESWKTIERLLNEMRPLLIEVGIRNAVMPVVDPEVNIALSLMNDSFDWLHRLYLSPEYKAALRIFLCVPASHWEGYRANNIHNLREQVLLAEKAMPLRKLWRTNRPAFFGKVFNARKDEA